MGGRPALAQGGLEDGVGQAVGRRPKLHMGFAVLTAPLEPVGFASKQPGPEGRRVGGGVQGTWVQL